MKSVAGFRDNLVLMAALIGIFSPSAASATAPQNSGHSPQFDAGCKLMQMKRFQDAVSSMTEAISVDPKDSLAFFRRAQCFYCLGKFDDAVADFDHAILLDKDVSTYFVWRGTAEAKVGHDKNAVRDYLKAMRLDPALVVAYNASQAAKPPEKKSGASDLASTPPAAEAAAHIVHPDTGGGAKSNNPKKNSESLSLGYNANAMQDYLEAIKLASIKCTAYFRPGAVYSGICEVTDTGSQLGVKLGSDTDGTITKKNGADYFSLNGNTKEIHEFETQIGEHPENAALYYERGRLLQQLGWNEMAMSDFDTAVSLDKANARYRLARAFLYHQSQKDDLARADIDQAINLDPNLPETITFGPSSSKTHVSTTETKNDTGVSETKTEAKTVQTKADARSAETKAAGTTVETKADAGSVETKTEKSTTAETKTE